MSNNNQSEGPSSRIGYIHGHPIYVMDNSPCCVCGRVKELVYQVEGEWKCYGCAMSWRLTSTNVMLRLEVFNPGIPKRGRATA